MKLRNKKTGEIGELSIYTDGHVSVDEVSTSYSARIIKSYNSLAELNKEWEDYEEPKEWYGLNAIRDVGFEPLEYEGFEDLYKHAKELGIAFETREEAERTVEKLKAWKRLKDFGCGFILDDHFAVKFVGPDARKITSVEVQKSLSNDYKLLFGGEE